MILSTSHFIDENKYEVIGLVQGVCIRSFGVLRRMFAGLFSLIGGKVEVFEDKYKEGYDEALKHILEKATDLKADAIYGLLPEVSELSMGSGNGMLVISMFGTAVRLRKKGGSAKSQSKKGKKCNKVCKKYKTKSKLYK
jgi:uncharacterized protein YbjQ (UPF0145 family)